MDEPVLMTAAEARKKIETGENLVAQKIWAQIVSDINHAIDIGDKSISNDGCLPESIINKLKTLGYKVYNGNQYNQDYYVISW